MAIYEITPDNLSEITPTAFSTVGLKERDDLQRLLRDQIEVISPDTLVIAEEFGEWEDSKRRIDLLGIDRNANIVVVELKRTEDGGHMELQAIRYASMVSTLTFGQVADIYGKFLKRHGQTEDAEEALLSFLDWEEPNQDHFAKEIRIVLASAAFSKELTTAVIWLNNQGLDIRCVRLRPYADGKRILLDVQQVIPLPEAEQYQVRLREKGLQERTIQQGKNVRYHFWADLLSLAREKTDLHANISPGQYSWIGAGSGIRGLGFNYTVRQHDTGAELYIDRGRGSEQENQNIYDRLFAQKEAIETAFGGSLSWERLDGRRASRIVKRLQTGGYKDDRDQWPRIHEELICSMIQLEKALRTHIDQLD